MDGEIIKYCITQGAFAALFVWLLIDTRKDSKAREEGYQATIKENQNIIIKLTEKFNIVENIQSDINDIKNYIFK